MLRAFVLSAFFFGSAAFSAQLGPQAATPAPRTWTMQPMTLEVSSAPVCPVQLQAQHRIGSQAAIPVVGGVSGGRAPNPAQHIRLVLSDEVAQNAVAARIVVRGLSGRSRTVLTPAAGTPAADRTRTVHVKLTPASPTENSADLILPGFSTVLSVQLVSLTYRDGTTWSAPAGDACRVTPDPLMPVAGN